MSRIEWRRNYTASTDLDTAEESPADDRAENAVASALAIGHPCSVETGGRLIIAWPIGEDGEDGVIDVLDVVVVRRGSVVWPATAAPPHAGDTAGKGERRQSAPVGAPGKE